MGGVDDGEFHGVQALLRHIEQSVECGAGAFLVVLIVRDQSPEEVGGQIPWTVADQETQKPAANADVEELFAEFERAAADEIQISSPDQHSLAAGQSDTVRFSEHNRGYNRKQSDISERPVYKQ